MKKKAKSIYINVGVRHYLYEYTKQISCERHRHNNELYSLLMKLYSN